MSSVLANVLGVRAGDLVEVETLEADRRTRRVRVGGTYDDMAGLAVYMDESALHRLLGEERVATGARLAIDPREDAAVVRALGLLPGVASVGRRDELAAYFRDQSGGAIVVMQFFLGVFAAIIAVGVVYNNARVTLAMRARELASLRVLGMTRGEVARIVLGEQAAHLGLGVPLGLILGRAMVGKIVTLTDPELIRLPAIVSARTYTTAGAVVLGAGLACAALIVAKVRELDLVSVLKARD
jgi:putative ABC transport system permease protein